VNGKSATGTEEASAVEPTPKSDEQSTSEPVTTFSEDPAAEGLQRRRARSFMIRRQDNTTSTNDTDASNPSSDDEKYIVDEVDNYIESFDNDVARDADVADDAISGYSEDLDNTAWAENTTTPQLAS
jgi:hypothetical protein